MFVDIREATRLCGLMLIVFSAMSAVTFVVGKVILMGLGRLLPREPANRSMVGRYAQAHPLWDRSLDG